MAAMYLLALRMAELRGTLSRERLTAIVADLKHMPHYIDEVVTAAEPAVEEIALAHHRDEFFLYLGRHVGLPVALEGALKLKEISYIATDAYAAGEMKHGPIALLSEATPVVAVATDSPVLDKVMSNVQEVRVRGAHVIAVASEGNLDIGEHADAVLRVPDVDWMLAPLLAVIPLQLLAYRIARRRELNVDQPRNLAKTVTVE
jgi:glucosamine--fructose-6-phosphate aminotransferase (isomerizing)